MLFCYLSTESYIHNGHENVLLLKCSLLGLNQYRWSHLLNKSLRMILSFYANHRFITETTVTYRHVLIRSRKVFYLARTWSMNIIMKSGADVLIVQKHNPWDSIAYINVRIMSCTTWFKLCEFGKLYNAGKLRNDDSTYMARRGGLRDVVLRWRKVCIWSIVRHKFVTLVRVHFQKLQNIIAFPFSTRFLLKLK